MNPKMVTKEADEPEVELFLKGLKLPLWVGTVLGLYPKYDGGRRRDRDKPASWSKSRIIFFMYCGSLSIFLIMNALLLVRSYLAGFNEPGQKLLEKFAKFNIATYSCILSVVYAYHLFHPSQFAELLSKFCQTISQFPSCCKIQSVSSFPIFCVLITTSSILIGVGNDFLYDWQSLKGNVHGYASDSSNDTLLSLYFHNILGHWHDLVPSYNPAITVIFLIGRTVASWGFLVPDAIVIILCHFLALKFRDLNEAIKSELVENETCKPVKKEKALELDKNSEGKSTTLPVVEVKSENKIKPKLTWDVALSRFWLLADLSKATERYLGPLIVTGFTYIGHVIVIIFAWIAPNVAVSSAGVNYWYVYCSTFHFCLRFLTVTYFVSEVYHSSRAILGTVERCPTASYCVPVQRLEGKITGNPVGIRLFGTFLLTRHFVLLMVSFIATTEIVLLQTTNAMGPAVV